MSYIERIPSQFFTFVQDDAAIEWTITHNLRRLPIVNVYSIVNGQEVVVNPTSVEVLDDNTCKLTFYAAISGIAEVW